jgi:hypothetical protein
MPAKTVLNEDGFLSVGRALEQLMPALQAVPGGAANACVAAPPDAPEPAAQFNQLIGNWTIELLNIAAHAQGLAKAATNVGQRLGENDRIAATETPG